MTYKILTATGYGGTGSSAVIDFASEFSNVHSLGNSEFWFLQDYDGVSDLEYFLLDGNHRSKVNLAVKKFKEYIFKHNEYYSKRFGEKYREISMNYIDSLIDAKFRKAISAYEIESNLVREIYFKYSPLIQYFFRKLFNSKLSAAEFAPYIPEEVKYYSSPDKQRFYAKTKLYVNQLIAELNIKRSINHVAIDQLVPAMNARRYLNYVNDLYVVIVDRDPRDLYLLNQLHWKGASYICNTSRVEEYVDWYKTMREHRKYEEPHSKIKYIMLESMIYDYENSINTLAKFFDLDIGNHINKKKHFNPDLSMQWTKIWSRDNRFNREVKYIESKLYDYCWS